MNSHTLLASMFICFPPCRHGAQTAINCYLTVMGLAGILIITHGTDKQPPTTMPVILNALPNASLRSRKQFIAVLKCLRRYFSQGVCKSLFPGSQLGLQSSTMSPWNIIHQPQYLHGGDKRNYLRTIPPSCRADCAFTHSLINAPVSAASP